MSFFENLIVAVLGCAAAGILAQVVTDKERMHQARRLTSAAMLTVLAVGLYFGMHGGATWVGSLRPHRLPSDPSPTPTPTPTPSPSPHPDPSPSPTPQPTPARQGREDSFIRENIAPPPKSTRRPRQWAVVIAGADGQQIYPQVASAVSAAIAEKGQSNVAIFRPSVLRQANFETLFAADPALDRRLGEYCDHVFVGKVTSSTVENSQLADLISVSLVLNARIISTGTGGIDGQFEAQSVGAGVKLDEARANAEERLAEQVRAHLQSLIRQQ